MIIELLSYYMKPVSSLVVLRPLHSYIKPFDMGISLRTRGVEIIHVCFLSCMGGLRPCWCACEGGAISHWIEMHGRTKKNSLTPMCPPSPLRPQKRISLPPPPPSSPPPSKMQRLTPSSSSLHSLSEYTPYTIFPSRSFSSRFQNPNLAPIVIPQRKKKLGIMEVDPELYIARIAGVATPKTAELKLPRLQGRVRGEKKLPEVREVVGEGVATGATMLSGNVKGRKRKRDMEFCGGINFLTSGTYQHYYLALQR